MKQGRRCIGATLAALAALMLWTRQAPAADPATSEIYVVRPGDTLSGIAGRVLGDTQRWREILKANPQVTDANRIYPGDSLVVPVPVAAAAPAPVEKDLQARPGEEVAAPAAPEMVAADAAPAPSGSPEVVAAPAAAPSSPVIEPVLPVEQVRALPAISAGTYQAAGFITEKLPTTAIVASVDSKEANGTGDAVIISGSADNGARFIVVRADRRVFHPKTKLYLGWLVRRLGTAEVTCPGEKASTAVLKQMRDSATVGDYLIPYDERDVLDENQLRPKGKGPCVSAGVENAMVVAFDDDRLIGAENEMVYIDKGRTAGVAPGGRFIVYRELSPEGRLMIGEIQILRAEERTATALVTNSLREIQIADLLRTP